MPAEPAVPADPPPDPDALGWWTISGAMLLGMLHRVAAGEDPDLVYAEVYANSEVPPGYGRLGG